MKILFLTRRFYPDIGGVEKHVLKVSKELIKRGHKVSVITESSPSNYHSTDQSDTYSINPEQPVKSSQIKIFRLNFGKNDWFKKIRIWMRLFRQYETIKDAEIVHCHDVFFWYFPFRFLFPLKKVYTTFHGFETKFPPTIKARLVRKISEKLSYGNICVGEYIKKWYGTKPDYVTYGGVEKTQNFNKNRGSLNILLLGRLEEDNGVKIYLEALRELKKQKVAYNLVVCGDGSYKKQFEKFGKVKGFIPDLNKYIDRSDFIFASSYLSILEALFRGKNVFTVFQNELKKDYLELSPFNDYVCIAGNSRDLVKQVLSIHKNPYESYNRLLKAQVWSKAQSWAKVADLYLKLWEL